MEKMDFEENIEDGLHSQSLELVASCSSSILDSDDEEDGINVTIKEVVPGGSAVNTAGQKLAGAARRKIKKMLADGIEAEVVGAKVISSTPKRSRNAALDSSNGSAEIKPVPKKMCESATTSEGASSVVGDQEGSGQIGPNGPGLLKKEKSEVAEQVTGEKKEGKDLGNADVLGSTGNKSKKKKKKSKVNKKKSDDVKLNDGAGAAGASSTGASSEAGTAVASDGAAAASDGAGSGGSAGRGGTRGGKQKGGETEGGSANKKIRRENLPAPTYQQIASRIKLGIIPAGYPDAELSSEQQEAVKEELLKKVLAQRREQSKPKFVYCKAKAGLVMLLCQDKCTADWVKLATSSIVPWENAQLSALDEVDIPRRVVLRAFFYRSKQDENDTILGYLESQNDNLDTSAWRILRRTVKNDHVDWAFTVDSASLNLLEKWKFVVNYKFGQTMFRKQQSDNGSHPVDDDSDEDMDVELNEGLASEALVEREMAQDNELPHSSGTGASFGKQKKQKLTGEYIKQDPRALNAQGSIGGSTRKLHNSQTDSSGKDCLTNPRALNAQGSESGSSGPETNNELQGDHQPEIEGGKTQQ